MLTLRACKDRLSTATRRRRGSTVTGVLLGLAIVGGFAITAMLVRPAVLRAGGPAAGSGISATCPQRQSVADALAILLHAAEVVAVHDRHSSSNDGGPYVHIVLRFPDDREAASPQNLIPAGELAVLSHSRILETVMYYSITDEPDVEGEHPPRGDGGGGEAGVARRSASSFATRSVAVPERGEEERAASALSRSDLLTGADVASRAFCTRWRHDASVTPRIIATGVSDLHVQWMDSPEESEGRPSRRRMRIALRWSPDSADGEDEAVLFVDVAWRPMQ